MRSIRRFVGLLAILIAFLIPIDTPVHAQQQRSDYQLAMTHNWGCETVNCQPRRESGVGNTIRFYRGEAVVGYRISLDNNNRWGWNDWNDNRNDNDRGGRRSHQRGSGTVLTLCFLPYAESDGWVTDGAVNPYEREAHRQHNC